VKASRNSTPQGPVAIPPRQGQFQLISPLGRINPGDSSSSGSLSEVGCIKSSGVKNMILSLPVDEERKKRRCYNQGKRKPTFPCTNFNFTIFFAVGHFVMMIK